MSDDGDAALVSWEPINFDDVEWLFAIVNDQYIDLRTEDDMAQTEEQEADDV